MKTITFEISDSIKFELVIPDDYQKKELPYFKEWTEALDSGSYSQTSGQLCETISYPESTQTCYCCLGVLSKIQGRLTANNRDGSDPDSTYYLSHQNPIYPFLSLLFRILISIFNLEVPSSFSIVTFVFP